MRLLPNKKVKIITGKFKNQIKHVQNVRGSRVILKDLFQYSRNKKMYKVSIHISNLKIVNDV